MKDVLARHRLVICVGTGGVGKTTVSAALALGAARANKRAMVLTIDPARALGRALGVDLVAGALVAPNLHAAMLDQKRAWDDFVARHAPNDAAARVLLGNAFYQRLSTAFAGSAEYMAIEEMCRLVESGAHDLVVLDTPPSAHAIDFLRAPERIDRLLDEPHVLVGSLARFVVRQLERAAGSATLREIAAFFRAMTALVGGVRDRTRRARALLRGGEAAFVLVTGPRVSILDDTRALATALEAHTAPLAAVVVNRTHPVLPQRRVTLREPWLQARWDEAVADAAAEATILDPFVASLPSRVRCVRVPEARHDVCSLAALADIATQLGL
jgi:anion-transporting  ArsA/GET3 family ATPase